MAQDFARHIYNSKAWKGTAKNKYKDGIRHMIVVKYNYLCAECGQTGDEVHHIIPLTPNNINDYSIVYGADNLILLCFDCHKAKHSKHKKEKNILQKNLFFDENGNLLSR